MKAGDGDDGEVANELLLVDRKNNIMSTVFKAKTRLL